MTKPTVAANAAGLPEYDHAALLLPEAYLATLSNSDLCKVAAILRAASDMMAYSDVHAILEDISGMLVCAARDVRSVVENRVPKNKAEANWRGWLIISHAAFVSEPLVDIAALAAQAAVLEQRVGEARP